LELIETQDTTFGMDLSADDGERVGGIVSAGGRPGFVEARMDIEHELMKMGPSPRDVGW
jgi:hypothetical protein